MSARSLSSRLCVACLCSVLAACAPKDAYQAVTKIGMIMWDPSMPVGDAKDQPSTAQIILVADQNANADEYGDAPIDVWLFQLSNDDQLMSADYDMLFSDPKSVLGDSYISHKTKQVAPGESAILPLWKLDDETVYFGVAVAYKSLAMEDRGENDVPSIDAIIAGQAAFPDDNPVIDAGNGWVIIDKRVAPNPVASPDATGRIAAAPQSLRKPEARSSDPEAGIVPPEGTDAIPIVWRVQEKIKPTGETYTFVVPVRKNEVSIQLHRYL